MNPQQEGILTLIKSSVTGEKYRLPTGFDLHSAAQVAKNHGILTMLYYGALGCGIPSADPLMQQLFAVCCRMVVISEKQLYEVKRLLKAFDASGIDSLPLKGVILKHLYPKPEMRRMGDADILIREEQYPKIKTIMESAGYIFRYETDHEIVWEKPTLNLELHRKLVPERNREFYAYFGTGWGFAVQSAENPHRYDFTKETNMLFLFTHLAKHYTGGGIGIQHMTDLWIYQRCNPELDHGYICRELKKLKLDKFYENVMHTVRVWFEGEQPSDISEFITEFIFASGVYGTHTNRILSYAARDSRYHGGRKKGYWSKVLRAIFPSRSELKVEYPVLKKVPVLLPFVWIVRWFKLLFFKRDKIGAKLRDIRQTTDENVDTFQQSLNFVGLDFQSKE